MWTALKDAVVFCPDLKTADMEAQQNLSLKKNLLLQTHKPDVLVISKLTYIHFSGVKGISWVDKELSH